MHQMLPTDFMDAVLLGRLELDAGPTPIAIRHGLVEDLSPVAPTIADLLSTLAPGQMPPTGRPLGPVDRFRLRPASAVTHVRLDVFPDGGMARLRLTGLLTRAGREQLVLRWFTLLPPAHATQVLTAEGVPVEVAEATVAARPPGRADDLPDAIRAAVGL